MASQPGVVGNRSQSTFARFPPRLQQAIVSRLGWTSLRPVQELAGAAILDGCNAVVLAPTAGGKTEASMFPLLAQMVEAEPTSVGVVYIAPIKALLNNQADRLGVYTEMVGLRRFLWHGDVTAGERKRFLKEPADLLMTTPESLEVMLLSSRVPHPRLFADLRAVVIDEVHALAGTDRGAHLMSVLERITRHSAHDVQRIGLSATVGNPADILAWVKGSSQRPGRVIDPPKPPSSKEIRIRHCPSVEDVAEEACQMAEGQKSLFFCQSRAVTETVADRLRGREIDVFVHHSSVSLEERQAAEARFHHGTNVMITCTSTLELGIDVGDLDRIFQAEASSTVSSFLQRLGRTGRRAGQKANTLFFCQDPETVLQAAAIIELAREGWVESTPVQHRCWPIVVHQLLALSLQYGGISPERCWEELSRVPDFSGISQPEFSDLVNHLVAQDYLFSAGGLLSMGDRAEKVFGRRNFQELYAVFSSPQLYRVITEGGRDIGSLEQDFVDKLVADMSSFLLGGRAWLVKETFHKERVVRVVPAPAGKKPSWGGYIPQFLGFHLCRRMARILADEAPLPYLDDRAQGCLNHQRAERGALLRDRSFAIEVHGDEEQLWTYAGGTVNQTLKYALGLLYGWTVAADNFRLRIRREPGQGPNLPEALGHLAQPDTWADPEFQRRRLLAMPEYRLSKFQDALPPRCSLEVVRDYLLDVPTTVRYLAEALGRELPQDLSSLMTLATADPEPLPEPGLAELPTERPPEPSLAVRSLTDWEAGLPRLAGWVLNRELDFDGTANPDTDFVAALVGRALDKLYEPGTLGLFRRLGPDDDLPELDAIVLVHDESLADPDLDQATVRRFSWQERTDADGKVNHVQVDLRPRTTDRRQYRTQNLKISPDHWPTWRPYAVMLGSVQIPSTQGEAHE